MYHLNLFFLKIPSFLCPGIDFSLTFLAWWLFKMHATSPEQARNGISMTSFAYKQEWSRAKKRKAQLISGEGDPEPVRSRNNSLCHSSFKRKDNPVFHLGSNPEADANEFLLTAGGIGNYFSIDFKR